MQTHSDRVLSLIGRVGVMGKGGGGTGYCFAFNKYILRHRDLEARSNRSYDKKENTA